MNVSKALRYNFTKAELWHLISNWVDHNREKSLSEAEKESLPSPFTSSYFIPGGEVNSQWDFKRDKLQLT